MRVSRWGELRTDCSRVQRALWTTTTSTLLAGALLFTACEKKEAPPTPSPPEVDVTRVTQQNVPIYREWIAQLNGPVNAQITPKVQGYLLRQAYKNGYFVNKGQILFEIDPRPFQAALDQSKAEVAVAEANLSRTEVDVERDTPLAAQLAIPRKQLENDVAQRASWKAQVEAKRAALRDAELNLEWTRVLSPVHGIAGASKAQVGDLVGPSTKMTTVSQVDPIWAYFNVSESVFLEVAPELARIIRGTSSLAEANLPSIEFIQTNDVPYPHEGRFVYVDRQVGTQTGTIQIAGEFPNNDATLRPGGFGRVRVRTGMNKGALLVPQAAVIETQSVYQVVVVTPDDRAHFRTVKVGERTGANWVIAEGLRPEETIVVQGFMKLKEGMLVRPRQDEAAAGHN
jgi:membrane fusion protein, multidrug efflux system